MSLSMGEEIRDFPLRVQKREEVEINPLVPLCYKTEREISPCWLVTSKAIMNCKEKSTKKKEGVHVKDNKLNQIFKNLF